MAIENAKTLNVRIRNKYDSYENWAASSLVLEAGEIAIAYTTVDVKVDNGTAKHPALLMKVGDGEKTFANLPWLSAKAADVLAVCKNEDELKTFVNGVIADAGIASNDAMQTLAGRVTTAEGEIDALQADLNTDKTGLKARVSTAEAAINALDELVGDEKVADQITKAINDLNLAETYAAKVHGHVIADVDGLSDSIAAAKKAGTDANAALEAYKTLNDAAVKVNSDAIAGIKNGDTIDNFAEVEEALAGKQAAGDYSVNGHKHEITDVNGLSDAIADAKKAGTDASAAAGKALTDAKSYTDSEMTRLVGDTKVADQITTAITNLDLANTYDAKGTAAAAETAAKGYADGLDAAMDARVKVVEGKAHTHSFVESELNLIKTGDVDKWNSAEQNAKDYADGLDNAMDARVLALEGKFGTGEGNVESQISAAVAAEAAIARAAEEANAKAVTDLANGAVKDNADAIAALEGLVGETSVVEQIENALKVEVEGVKVEKYALATALDAETATARAAEKANADAIKVLNGTADTEGSVDYKIAQKFSTLMENPDEAMNSIKELVDWTTEHAADALEMSNQVTANKNAIATLNGDASTVGSVDKKIADAIAAENLGQYATDGEMSDLTDRVAAVESDLNTETTGLKARMTAAETDIDALETKVGDKTVAAQIEAAIDALKIGDYAKAADLTAAINQHNTDKAALEAEIDKKANDADLKAVAKSGLINDLSIAEGTVLVFDCGTSAV